VIVGPIILCIMKILTSEDLVVDYSRGSVEDIEEGESRMVCPIP
jgi:hypothetical protein